VGGLFGADPYNMANSKIAEAARATAGEAMLQLGKEKPNRRDSGGLDFSRSDDRLWALAAPFPLAPRSQYRTLDPIADVQPCLGS
jgi:hypothetical protein